MSKSIDIDKAGECLRNIVDNNRCGICDKFGKIYRRCVHGHIACDVCSEKDEGCLICFTTLNSPVFNNTWLVDKLQPEKVRNALDLLTTFQDTFKTDVYKRQRISDQLKVEKELFPDCIQAPVKYCNKRKSLQSSINDKENHHHSFYPGESISSQQKLKMQKSKYVQQWLEGSTKNSSKRKPFTNINVNNQRLSSVLNDKSYHKPSKVKNKTLNKSKRSSIIIKNKKVSNDSHPKTSLLECGFHTSKEVGNTNLNNIEASLQLLNTSKMKDDSGIAMDEECITIEDTSTEIIDKDELALRAVHEAEKNQYWDDFVQDNLNNQSTSNKHEFIKVPYEKKCLLYISCPNCKTDDQNYDQVKGHHTNNISITIEYSSKVESDVNMQSVSVQTEISWINKNSDAVNNIVINDTKENKKCSFSQKNTTIDDIKHIESQDIFMDDTNIVNTHKQNLCNKENVVYIEESDTDIEAEHIQVEAEVHRTCQPKDYNILSELAQNEIKNRKRRAERGATPGSTDSSEKENFDPNRKKRSKLTTKKDKKKSNKR